jgi:GTP cyclohydrolase IA
MTTKNGHKVNETGRKEVMTTVKRNPSTLLHNRHLTESTETSTAIAQEANERVENLMTQLLIELGEDPEREGLQLTPSRVRKSMAFLTSGYTKTPQEALGTAIFDEHYDEMVLVRDIEMYSMCEHHMLPFYGKCHIAYIPNGKIVGLSKLPRIVDVFSRRLQVQERLTTQIANALDELLHPLGVAVVTEAVHFCMMMRGVQKQNSMTLASCMIGEFQNNPSTRAEFLNLIQRPRHV